jgi:hypothetical protein
LQVGAGRAGGAEPFALEDLAVIDEGEVMTFAEALH